MGMDSSKQYHRHDGHAGGDPRSNARAEFPSGYCMPRTTTGEKSIMRAEMFPAFYS